MRLPVDASVVKLRLGLATRAGDRFRHQDAEGRRGAGHQPGLPLRRREGHPRGGRAQSRTTNLGLMKRFFGIVLTMMVVLMLSSFVLAHLAIVIAAHADHGCSGSARSESRFHRVSRRRSGRRDQGTVVT